MASKEPFDSRRTRPAGTGPLPPDEAKRLLHQTLHTCQVDGCNYGLPGLSQHCFLLTNPEAGDARLCPVLHPPKSNP